MTFKEETLAYRAGYYVTRRLLPGVLLSGTIATGTALAIDWSVTQWVGAWLVVCYLHLAWKGYGDDDTV
jgi:hypothetical protein